MELEEFQKLIEADLNAQKDVKKAHDLKATTKDQVAAQKEAISQASWDKIHQEVADRKVELDQMMKKEAATNKEQTELIAKKIEDTYQEKKDEWEKEIVARCIQ